MMTFTSLDFYSFLSSERYFRKIIQDEAFLKFIEATKIYRANLIKNENQGEDALVSNALLPFLQALDFTAIAKSRMQGKSEIDLVITNENHIEVIFEAKKWDEKSDFLSSQNINCKSLHQSILYYFRERENGNSSIKFIIITDFYRFYMFKASEFERLFYDNKNLKMLFKNHQNKTGIFKNSHSTQDFYDETSKILSSDFKDDKDKDANLQGFLIDFNDIFVALDTGGRELLTFAFKLFHRDFLLDEFIFEANALNTKFYYELLHILGLSEDKDGKLLPSKESKNAQGTLYNAINNELGAGQDSKELNETTIQFLILWLNRILFLKLIEANLVRFNDDKKLAFLNTDKIESFKNLNELFFDVLAKEPEFAQRDANVGATSKPPLNIAESNMQDSILSPIHSPFEQTSTSAMNGHEKRGEVNAHFAYLPYLNSSLFEKHEIETLHNIEIAHLNDNLTLDIFHATNLKDGSGKIKRGKLNLLNYLLDFLNSYDFGSVDSKNVAQNENLVIPQKELINSSVLSNVFEKLNAYKDGSFYTPSLVTKQMCEDIITQIVLDRFNASFELDCKNLEELRKDLRHEKSDEKIKILESIKICDPSVGSAHFLVSALNAMLKIYDVLNLFENDFSLEIQDSDDVVIRSPRGNIISYKRPKNANDEAQKIQKEIFHTKAQIIENNLFGVDINPASCEISKLRLWIELLKHSYYLDSNLERVGAGFRVHENSENIESKNEKNMDSKNLDSKNIMGETRTLGRETLKGGVKGCGLEKNIESNNCLGGVRTLGREKNNQNTESTMQNENIDSKNTQSIPVQSPLNVENLDSIFSNNRAHNRAPHPQGLTETSPASVTIRAPHPSGYANASHPHDYHAMQTLPNIDINIKCGNSLISYFDLKNSLAKYPNIKEKIDSYKKNVELYKEGLGNKKELNKTIANLKAGFRNFSFNTTSKVAINNFHKKCGKYSDSYGNYLAQDDKNLWFIAPRLPSLSYLEFDKAKAARDFAMLKEEYKKIYYLDPMRPFEWRFEFPEVLDSKGDFMGFDIIIGNPPYIRHEEIKHYKTHLQNRYKIYASTADIYTYFFERGFHLLKPRGILGFITSNKYTRAGYGENLRKFLLENTRILSYHDLNGIKVFKNATVDTGILTFRKGANLSLTHRPLKKTSRTRGLGRENIESSDKKNMDYKNLDSKNAKDSKSIPTQPPFNVENLDSISSPHPLTPPARLSPTHHHFKGERAYAPAAHQSGREHHIIYTSVLQGITKENPLYIPQSRLTQRAFLFVNESDAKLQEKIESIGTALSQWQGLRINRGLLTGLNKAFIIDTARRNLILAACADAAEREATEALIRPVLRGRDIKRYGYEWAGLWIINTHNGYKGEGGRVAPVDINAYPALKAWLDTHYPSLAARDDKGATPYNLRNCAYLEDFAGEKIIFSEIVRAPQFYLDDSGIFIEATGFILTGGNLKYLLGFLNSPFVAHIFKTFYAGGNLGAQGYRYKRAFLERLPIPPITRKNQKLAKKLENLVDELLALQGKNLTPTHHPLKKMGGLRGLGRNNTESKTQDYKNTTQNENLDSISRPRPQTPPTSVENPARTFEEVDKEIDELVFQLYELSENEIKILKDLAI